MWIIFIYLSHHIGNVIIPTDELIFFRGVGIPPTSCSFMPYFTRAHHWSWYVWGPFSRPSGHFLSAAEMVTPTESGRKHARVDWKGRYLKFRNEARMAGAQLFHMANRGLYLGIPKTYSI